MNTVETEPAQVWRKNEKKLDREIEPRTQIAEITT